MEHLVSIITPTYNHEKYISDCIQSVINQTYKNWEMIIIDDCSTDRTSSLIRKYAMTEKRIKIISHKTNWGITKLNKSYNQALRKSKGKFIAILEGDDFWPVIKLQEQIKSFKDKKVVLSYGNWAMVNQSGRVVYTRDYKKFEKDVLNNSDSSSILNLFLTMSFDIGSQTVMIKKKSLLEIGGFKKDRYYPFIDIPTYLYLSSKGPFSYVPKVLGFYRRTAGSAWFKFASKSQTMGRNEIANCINGFIKNKTKLFSATLDWKTVEAKQKKYLFIRKILYLPSIVFNRLISTSFW